MALGTEGHRVRLSIDVAPDLLRQLKVVAAQREQSVREFVEAVLAEAIAGAAPPAGPSVRRAQSRSLGAGQDADFAARHSKAWLRDHWAGK
jgi:hypothetical protein